MNRKPAVNEITRKFYSSDTPAQAKSLKTGIIPAPEIKSYVDVGGQLIEEELHEELTETIKAISQALAAARQILEA